MNLRYLIAREMLERPSAMLASTLSILLGVAALIAIQHITKFSEQEVGRQMESLGANVLVLPKAATLQNYYAADLTKETLPETHVASILMANLPGVERLSPRLCVPAKLNDVDLTVTGILPQSEFKASAAWQSVALFSHKHEGCKRAAVGPKELDGSPESLVSARSIDQLEKTEAVVGIEVAERCQLKTGDTIPLLGSSFQVVSVLPRTGTVDDSRVFAHLHAVQEASNAGEVINAIEVMGCCEDAAGNLVGELSKLLPDAKVVTISHVVSAQVGVNRLMGQMSLVVLAVLVLIGGASVASTIASNVRERRREIGTLMALGATPAIVGRLFLGKALALGVIGSVCGCVLGLVLALVIGAQAFGVSVRPLPGLLAMAAGSAILITLLAAYLPSRGAAKLDPCCCFQEI
jgi:putative ABC transport system permease protein